MAGSTRFNGPVPLTGSQPSFTENRKSSIRPSQKCGIETPAIAAIIRPVSARVPCLYAARKPIGSPTMIATAIAVTARMRVFGSRWRMTSRTG